MALTARKDKQSSRRRWHPFWVLLMVFVFVSACAERKFIEPDFNYSAEKRKLDENTTIIGKDTREPILSIPVSGKVLLPVPLEEGDPLPNIPIKNFSAVDATVAETFRLLVLDEGIAVSADPSVTNIRINLFDLKGSLQSVMDRISETSGVFYLYKDGLLRVMPKRNFVVTLPPIKESFAGIATVLTSMGAENTNVDEFARLITFTADRKSYDKIRFYLANVKENKVLIVYETYVYEVQLNDDKALGIDWSNFSLQNDIDLVGKFKTVTAAATDGVTLSSPFTIGAVYNGATFDLNTTLTFLKKQGDVEIVSQPTITMISGGSSEFEVAEEEKYVSEVNTTTEDNIINKDIQTETLKTGTKIKINGDYLDETVFTGVEIEISDLVTFTPVSIESFDSTTGNRIDSTEINLPKTSKRMLKTAVRMRPGDTVLLAGINESRDQRDRKGIPFVGGAFPQNTVQDQVDRSEIVIVMTPRVIRFDAKPEPKKTPEKTPEPAAGKPVAVEPLAPVVEPVKPAGDPTPVVNDIKEDVPLPTAKPEKKSKSETKAKKGKDSIDALIDELAKTTPAPAAGDAAPKGEAPKEVKTPGGGVVKQMDSQKNEWNRDIGNDPFHERFQYFKKDGTVGTSSGDKSLK